MLAIFLIPAALCCPSAAMVGDAPGLGRAGRHDPDVRRRRRCRHALRAAGQSACWPRWASIRPPAALQSGGNMEGKECASASPPRPVRTITTAASCGAVIAMHDSFTPLGGMVPLVLMQLGEVVFGGVGTGLYGMLVFAILAVFIAGLMIGRTPEYLGKKIEVHEMKMTLDRHPRHAAAGAAARPSR
jgi:K+-transporting ATPase ATPase A chain